MVDKNTSEEVEVKRFLEEHCKQAEPDENFRRAVLGSTSAIVASRNRRRLGWYKPRLVLGAGVAALALLVVLHFTGALRWGGVAPAGGLLAVTSVQGQVNLASGQPLKLGERIDAGAVVQTGKDGRVTLVTRNGSLLHLDSRSRLAILRDGYASIERGRLYCSNRMHEIKTIDTPAGSIRLLGTVLDASVINKDTAAVTVVQGKVELSNSHGARIVAEGNRAIMAASLAPEEGSPVNTAQETAWYEGRNSIVSDTGEIAYMVYRSKGVPRGQRGAITELWTMKSDGSEKHLVKAFLGTYGNLLGDWYPGGQWIIMRAFGRNNMTDPSRPAWADTMRLVNVSTGQDAYLPLPNDFTVDDAAVSPDGKRIAIAGSRERNFWLSEKSLTDSEVTERGIWIYNVETNEMKLLVTSNKKQQHYIGCWSPDSRWLSVSDSRGDREPNHILLADTHTGEIRKLIDGYTCAFSPDGTRLAYFEPIVTPICAYPGALCVIDAANAGNTVRLVPAGVKCRAATWSPDGSKIAFATEAGRNLYVIHTVEADGSEVRDIYTAKNDIYGLSWERDGKALYMRMHKTILKIAADGSGLIADLGGNAEDSILPDQVNEQLAQVRKVIVESMKRSQAAEIRMYQGRLKEARSVMKEMARDMSELPWKYPLANVNVSDITAYADAVVDLSSMSNEEALSIACKVHMLKTHGKLTFNFRGKAKLPQSVEGLQDEKPENSGYVLCGIPDSCIDGLACPGKHRNHPVPYIYTPPKNGEPKIGDVILQCPNHPTHKIVWNEDLEWWRNRPPHKPVVKK